MKTGPSPVPLSTLLFAGVTLASLALAAAGFIGWMNARNEAALLRTELNLANAATRDAEQQLEALKIINRRQLEMIRSNAPQSKNSESTP